jgi:hypothetical protein
MFPSFGMNGALPTRSDGHDARGMGRGAVHHGRPLGLLPGKLARDIND